MNHELPENFDSTKCWLCNYQGITAPHLVYHLKTKHSDLGQKVMQDGNQNHSQEPHKNHASSALINPDLEQYIQGMSSLPDIEPEFLNSLLENEGDFLLE